MSSCPSEEMDTLKIGPASCGPVVIRSVGSKIFRMRKDKTVLHDRKRRTDHSVTFLHSFSRPTVGGRNRDRPGTTGGRVGYVGRSGIGEWAGTGQGGGTTPPAPVNGLTDRV